MFPSNEKCTSKIKRHFDTYNFIPSLYEDLFSIFTGENAEEYQRTPLFKCLKEYKGEMDVQYYKPLVFKQNVRHESMTKEKISILTLRNNFRPFILLENKRISDEIIRVENYYMEIGPYIIFNLKYVYKSSSLHDYDPRVKQIIECYRENSGDLRDIENAYLLSMDTCDRFMSRNTCVRNPMPMIPSMVANMVMAEKILYTKILLHENPGILHPSTTIMEMTQIMDLYNTVTRVFKESFSSESQGVFIQNLIPDKLSDCPFYISQDKNTSSTQELRFYVVASDKKPFYEIIYAGVIIPNKYDTPYYKVLGYGMSCMRGHFGSMSDKYKERFHEIINSVFTSSIRLGEPFLRIDISYWEADEEWYLNEIETFACGFLESDYCIGGSTAVVAFILSYLYQIDIKEYRQDLIEYLSEDIFHHPFVTELFQCHRQKNTTSLK